MVDMTNQLLNILMMALKLSKITKMEMPTTAKFLLSHLLCFIIPSFAFLFLLSGPHTWWSALLWPIPIWLTVIVDIYSPKASYDDPPNNLQHWPFDCVLYLLAALQIGNLALLLTMASQLQWSSGIEIVTSLLNLFAIKVVVGTSSSFSGLVVAHELIHRTKRHMRLLGRLLLALTCYEHFATEHIRGHHLKVGTLNDPATAYYGESYREFWRRTVPAQFKSAWRLENKRLKIDNLNFCDKRLVHHHVFQGLLFEVSFILCIGLVFGISALAAFLIQALAAVNKLEAVNYIEHWGLIQPGDKSDRTISWDTDSWFTLHTLVGLSRHTNHHQNAHRPYHLLRPCPDSPKLPYGYFAMVFLSVCANKRYQELVDRELKAQNLRPCQPI